MKPSQNIGDLLNKQIQSEFYASYLYLSMSAYCESRNLLGFARYMRQQSQEEHSHAMRLFDYVQHRGGQVILRTIDPPPAEFHSALEMFQQALEHERTGTSGIDEIRIQASAENDYATEVEMQWFVKEQVKEEKTASEIFDRLKRAGDNSACLMMLDGQLDPKE